MRIYLAGPMSGIPYMNFPAFKFHRERLRAWGHEVFCPAENDINKYGVDFSGEAPDGSPAQLAALQRKYGLNIRSVLKDDLVFICDHAEAVYFMKGWENSVGAGAEFATAKAVRAKFFYEGASEFELKCRRGRDWGPTPCLCCTGECVG
jgi:hypothetical protein